jgi:enoyl-CoA hydratase/carnithine racemase
MLLQERDGPILTITLNLPEKRNPISDSGMVDALCAAMEAADRDITVRCVILTGAGSAFSSGGDLKAMRADAGGLRSSNGVETRRNYKFGIQRLPLLFQSLEVPVVAAINGHAIGAGLDLATMCDVRIAAESAKFAESFVKLGIIPGDGGHGCCRVLSVSAAPPNWR